LIQFTLGATFLSEWLADGEGCDSQDGQRAHDGGPLEVVEERALVEGIVDSEAVGTGAVAGPNIDPNLAPVGNVSSEAASGEADPTWEMLRCQAMTPRTRDAQKTPRSKWPFPCSIGAQRRERNRGKCIGFSG